MNRKLVEVNQQASDLEEELSDIEPTFASLASQQLQLNQDMLRIRDRIEALYGKQGRGRQFLSIAERNTFLKSQVTTLQSSIKSRKELRTKLQKEANLARETFSREKLQLEKAMEENNKRGMYEEQLNEKITLLISSVTDLRERSMKAKKEMERLEDDVAEARRELDRGKQQLNATLPRHITTGLSCVENIAKEKKLTGYFGPVIDNIMLKDEAYRTAVEVAAGNSLFHVIVDNDHTAALLMKELERRKSGRLTFLPLNRLRVTPVTFPDSADAKPLLDTAIEYDEAYEPAMRQVRECMR